MSFLVEEDSEDDPYAGVQFCLAVCEVGVKNSVRERGPIFKGLLLESVPGIIQGQFRRVGLFVYYCDFYEGNLGDILEDETCWAHDSIYEALAGLDENGTPQYFIAIV
jgi:hypothetical protein